MKRLIVLLALFGASAVPAPAFAGGGNANAAWWLLGGAVLGGALHAHAQQQRAVPPYGGYRQQPQVIVVERQVPQVVVVRETAPTTVVVAATDPKTVGTGCVSRTYGWQGQWIALPNGSKACKAF